MAGHPREARRWWQAHYTTWMAAEKYEPTGATGDVLTYTRRYIPTPAVVFAILLFPFGLVLLLMKREAILTVEFAPKDDRTIVTITGTARPEAIGSLWQVAAQQQRDPPV